MSGLLSDDMTLSVQDLRKTVTAAGGVEPLFHIPSLELAAGEELCVRGPSGSGKSTLLHCLAGVVVPDSGSVRIAGHRLFELSEAKRDQVRAAHIGYVFQAANLLPGLTVLENVELPLYLAGISPSRPRATELCEKMRLGHRLDAFPPTLSGGEAQRVALARALASRPSVVLADEPTASLDEDAARTALELLRKTVRDAGAVLVLVTHDARIAASFDRTLTLGGST